MNDKINFLSWVRIFLYPFALLYGGVIWLRNRLYDAGFSSSVKFSTPVITVGNLNVGGTGKTPHVEYLVRLLQYEYKVATMSRGYKRSTQGFLLAGKETNALQIGDEPMQYHLKFPELVVSVAEDRMLGIPELLGRRPEVEIILLDDAYQHRSVRAGLNILITEYSKPYYEDYILPFGRLREGRSAAKRADIIVVSKSPVALQEVDAESVRTKLKAAGHQQVFFTSLRYGQPYDFFTGAPFGLAAKNILLVCAIARPQPLIIQLETCCKEVHVLSYPDHHYFLSKDLEEIKSTFEAWQSEAKVIVTTEKDATRLHLHRKVLSEWGIPVVVMPVEVVVLLNQQDAFDIRVKNFVQDEVNENFQAFHFSETE